MKDCKKKSIAIMTFFTIPGDCIDRVTAQNGDRVLFERLATPRPAPKVSLSGIGKASSSRKSSSCSSPFHTDGPTFWKQRATWESKAEVQDDSKHIAEADQVPGSRKQSTSQTNVDTHHSDKEVNKKHS